MKLLSRIIDRLNILSVRFGPAGGENVELTRYALKGGKPVAVEKSAVSDISALKDELSKAPLILAVSGKGVITKEPGEIVSMVTSDPGKFIWTVADGAGGGVTFVRRDQLERVSGSLEEAGAVAAATECLSADEEENLYAVAERFFSERLKWRLILKPSPESSQLASLVAKRLRLPVLGIVLLALMANFMVSSRVRDEFQSTNAELAALRKSASSALAGNNRKQAALEQFSRRLPYRFGWLSDRIAAAVPEKVVLSELAVSPVTKTVEAGKPVQQNERAVVIRGETPSSEAVAAFVESLSAANLGAVRLASVEQDRERPLLTFRIEIGL